jgi:hypothetical protein
MYSVPSQTLIDELTSMLRLDLPGMFAGISGLMSLVVQHLDNVGVRKLTIAFYSIIGIGVLIFLIGMFRGISRKAKSVDDDDGKKVWYWGIGDFSRYSLYIITNRLSFRDYLTRPLQKIPIRLNLNNEAEVAKRTSCGDRKLPSAFDFGYNTTFF